MFPTARLAATRLRQRVRQRAPCKCSLEFGCVCTGPERVWCSAALRVLSGTTGTKWYPVALSGTRTWTWSRSLSRSWSWRRSLEEEEEEEEEEEVVVRGHSCSEPLARERS